MSNKIWVALGAALLLGGSFTALQQPAAAEAVQLVPAPAHDAAAASAPGEAVAVLAGGCFWGVQGVYQHLDGVTQAVSGYAGGAAETAHYHVVGNGDTGHAEAVKIVYDPAKISYGQLLQVYFSVVADPTQLNRQGPDTGTQYRSAVFPQNAEQAQIARDYIAQLDAAHVYGRKIATTVEEDKPFYPAEDYHQNYLTLNPTQPYIAYNDIPKVQALQALFPQRYRDKPVLVN